MTEPTDKQLPDEQQLQEYLKGDSSVSHHYRQLPGNDVPESLDRLVLRQAEDAVKRPARPAWMRWTAPLAVAASALLVVSIVRQTGSRHEVSVSAPSMQAERAVREDASAETRKEESADVPSPARRAAPPPVAAPVAPERKQVAKDAGDAVLQEQQVAKAAAQIDNDAQLAKAERQKAELEATARAHELSATQRVARGEENEVAGPRDTVETPEPKAVLSYSRPIGAAASNTATIQRNYTDPEAWLRDIRQLRKDNKPAEADREWRRFRDSFPDYEVAETDPAREAQQ